MGILNKTSSIVLPFHFIIDRMPVKQIYTSKFLRGYFEYNLNWYDYVDSISNLLVLVFWTFETNIRRYI